MAKAKKILKGKVSKRVGKNKLKGKRKIGKKMKG